MTTDAATLFLRAVRDRAGDGFRLDELRSRAWRSTTFTGERIEVAFSIEGDDAAVRADELTILLNTGDVRLPGHVLADAGVILLVQQPGVALMHVEALTVEGGD